MNPIDLNSSRKIPISSRLAGRIRLGRLVYDRLVLVILALGIWLSLSAGAVKAAEITGAGATFPYPLYSAWANLYQKKTDNRLNYQSIGSGGGLKQILAKTVDFGASDAPQTVEWLDKHGIDQFPMTVGAIVIIVNIEGVAAGELRLDSAVLSDIYLGKIKNWSDAAIVKDNPKLKLPNLPITVVFRNDSSGTTYNFSDYLAKVNPETKAKIGVGTALEWPVGIGAKGNDGVAALVGRTAGSIGYVEFSYAREANLVYTMLKNKEGFFVKPTMLSFELAVKNADWANAPGFAVSLNNLSGTGSWPITAVSYILVPRRASEKTVEVLKFFDWSYRNGGSMAKSMVYAPIPDSVYNLVQSRWAKSITHNGVPIWPAK